MEDNDILSLLKDKKDYEKSKDYSYFKDILTDVPTTPEQEKKYRRTQEQIKKDNLKKYQKEYHRKANAEKKQIGIKHFNYEITPEQSLLIERIKALTGQSTQSILSKGVELLIQHLKDITNGKL
jgi:hypothetical protein